MDRLRKAGDSVGARIEVVASGVPVGWGEPVYGKLDADLAAAMMSINAVKGVEIGAGFAAVAQRGTEHSDEMTPDGFLSNHAGGILGGISTGQDVTVAIAVKPTSSIRLDRHSIDKAGRPVTVNTHGRHDPCVGIRATPIAEAMLALVLMDHALRHRAQNADVRTDTPRIRRPGARRMWRCRFRARCGRRRPGPRRSELPPVSGADDRRVRAAARKGERDGIAGVHLPRILHDGPVAGRHDRVAALEHGLRVKVREVLHQQHQPLPRPAKLLAARALPPRSRLLQALHLRQRRRQFAQQPGLQRRCVRAAQRGMHAPAVSDPARDFPQALRFLRDARGRMREAARCGVRRWTRAARTCSAARPNAAPAVRRDARWRRGPA